MPRPLCFLAQLTGLNPLNPAAPIGKSTGLVFMDVMAIIATGLALSLILLLWARYHVRKKKLRHHRNERATVSGPARHACKTWPDCAAAWKFGNSASIKSAPGDTTRRS